MHAGTLFASAILAGAGLCPVASGWQKSGRPPARQTGTAIGKSDIHFGGNSGVRLGGPVPAALDRLDHMTPEERDHVLGELPPDRRERLQQRLDEYHSLTPEERSRLGRQYAWFTHLPPERQDAVRKVFRKFTRLPAERQDAVRDEIGRIHAMSAAARKSRVHSGDFKSNYSKQEREIIEDMAAALPR